MRKREKEREKERASSAQYLSGDLHGVSGNIWRNVLHCAKVPKSDGIMKFFMSNDEAS